ncbi:hypothetical protein AB0G79_24700 [Streptomyces sp. NPDC020807]|uniref:hypothetical protein n=1 Tax=Streptomyces sp. NPDC020807 TaxID=3155119 RepID=UPI0033D0BC6A
MTFVLAGVIRSEPTRDSDRLGEFDAGRSHVHCRVRGGDVNGLGDIWNSWWLLTESGPTGRNAWVSAYYLRGGDTARASDGSDIPDCPSKVLNRTSSGR